MLYRKSRIYVVYDVGFYSRYVKKWRHFMQIRCKGKNWTAVAGSVDFFKLK